jgi:PST family polysaccharide transporter
MGMILLAKQASKIFLFYVILQRLVLIFVYIYSYKYYGLIGLGLSYVFTGLIHLILMTMALKFHFKISLSKKVYKLLLFILILTALTIFARNIQIVLVHYILGSSLFLFSVFYSYRYMKINMNIDLIALIKKKIKK